MVLNVAMSEHCDYAGHFRADQFNRDVVDDSDAYSILADEFVGGAALEKETTPVYDEIPEQHNPMIIAGFGRVGQIVARLVHLQHQTFSGD